MTQRKSANGGTSRPELVVETGPELGGGKIWIGQHDTDHDILVLDPAVTDPEAEILSLYSLTQHRVRSFPRATVLERIQPLSDEVGQARARKDYARRATLLAAFEEERSEERSERMSRQRDGVVAQHRRRIEALGLEYEGVRETAADRRPGRRTKCHSCGIALDDFAGMVCVGCDGVLCSCGACACKRPVVAE